MKRARRIRRVEDDRVRKVKRVTSVRGVIL